MRNLREAIRQKRPDLWKNKNWLLHNDKALAHTSLLVRDFLAKNNTLMMPQPPYSPDLAPLLPRTVTPVTTKSCYTSYYQELLHQLLPKAVTPVTTKNCYTSYYQKLLHQLLPRTVTPVTTKSCYTSYYQELLHQLLPRAFTPVTTKNCYTSYYQKLLHQLLPRTVTPVTTKCCYTSYYQELLHQLLQNAVTPVTTKSCYTSYYQEPLHQLLPRAVTPVTTKSCYTSYCNKLIATVIAISNKLILSLPTTVIITRANISPSPPQTRTFKLFWTNTVPGMATAFQKIDMDPEQQLYTPKIVDIAAAVIEMHGREDVNDEERAGRPSTSTTDEKINEVEKMILANRRITVREVAEDQNISIDSCHSIFINDLGMRRVAAKFVPKLLNCDQKQHRMNIANEMLDSVRDDPNLLQRVITGDEAWVMVMTWKPKLNHLNGSCRTNQDRKKLGRM
ncbi:hypothetical protein LAZ67_5003912 [Cordylochernes scorpioides]|uniref:Transposase n=1 Tax=Cordylochernes scorpioides TaxID=51811 RepID=A0ABY6KIA2_9ARAC|nr:hypothetical protein LAZ67_5003912 [Cordylochernes scorpioides]